MVGQEEFVEQTIDLEQAVARQLDLVIAELREALILHPVELGREALQHVLAELVLVVAGAGRSELELENELANEALLRTRGVGAVDGAVAAIDGFDVGRDVSLVLQMDAAEVAEGGDSEREKIGALPEGVAID